MLLLVLLLLVPVEVVKVQALAAEAAGHFGQRVKLMATAAAAGVMRHPRARVLLLLEKGFLLLAVW
jgi:hypothetical protein